MFLLIVAAAATVAQAAPAQWTHSTPVAHGNGQATATYIARPVVTTRQVGVSGGTRMSTERCLWTASINVERRLNDGASGRDMALAKTIKGSRHGSCMTNRRAIDQDIAARTSEINAHLVAVAERDQRQLRTEIETLAPTRQ